MKRRIDMPEYGAWSEMKKRCFCVRNKAYGRYGGRGIRVCDAWVHDFPAFLAHIGPRPSAQHSLDRINNEGHYEPGNVRWATKQEQAINRRTTYFLNHELARDVAVRHGVTPLQFRKRIHRGWSIEKAAREPLVKTTEYVFKGESHTLKEWADIVGLKHRTLRARIEDHGWGIEKALSTPRMRQVA